MEDETGPAKTIAGGSYSGSELPRLGKAAVGAAAERCRDEQESMTAALSLLYRLQYEINSCNERLRDLRTAQRLMTSDQPSGQLIVEGLAALVRLGFSGAGVLR